MVRGGSAPWNTETVAAAGSTQTDATAIPIRSSPAFIKATGSDDIKGIRLPPATEGKVFAIKNTGTGGLTGKLRIYPATGDAINLLGANNPLDMTSLASATFYALDGSTWYTVPTLPS